MARITLRGNPIETIGELPQIGSKAPDFTLVKSDVSETSLSAFAGKTVILNIFVSLDTGICATSVRRFNAEVSQRENTVVLCISGDLPFAHGRFCGAEGLEDVITLSVFRNPDFGKDYGVTLISGPTRGLLSRAVVVVGPDGIVQYTEQVPEIAQEPDYEAALAAL